MVGKETVKYVSGDCTSVAILALNPEFELSKVAERDLELCIVLLTLYASTEYCVMLAPAHLVLLSRIYIAPPRCFKAQYCPTSVLQSPILSHLLIIAVVVRLNDEIVLHLRGRVLYHIRWAIHIVLRRKKL